MRALGIGCVGSGTNALGWPRSIARTANTVTVTVKSFAMKFVGKMVVRILEA